jgi:hypothetical protein
MAARRLALTIALIDESQGLQPIDRHQELRYVRRADDTIQLATLVAYADTQFLFFHTEFGTRPQVELRRQFGIERGKLLAFQMNRLHMWTLVAGCVLSLKQTFCRKWNSIAALPNEACLCSLSAYRGRF